MKIECPHCGVKGRADSSYSGKMVKCPKCDILFEASPLGNGEDESPRESIAVTTEAVGDLGQENQEKQEDQEDDPLPDSKELEQADSGEQATENETIDLMDEVEQEPYGLEKEQCWQCGTDENGGEPFTARKGLLYCSNCVQQEEPEPVPVSEPEISHEELSELSELPELPDESIAAVPHFQDFTSSESVAEDDVDEDYPAHFTIIHRGYSRGLGIY